MAVTDVYSDWSTAAASNSPAGSATPEIDDELRNLKAQIKSFGSTHAHSGGLGAQVDHGGLAGLGDDDHSAVYLNNTRHDTTDRHGDSVLFVNLMTDYSSTSTVSGFGSTTIKKIFYKKLAKLVFVWFEITGTSNSAYVTFTLPAASKTTSPDYVGAAAGVDVGTSCFTNYRLPANSGTVSLYKNNTDAAWTTTGDKSVSGQFFYEAAS